MQTKTDIANFALAALGAGQINDISDPGDAAILCNNWIDDAIKEVLTEGQFQSTVRRTLLYKQGRGIDEWLYAFVLPSDCIVPLNVRQQSNLANTVLPTGPLFSNTGTLNTGNDTLFGFEANTLYTSCNPVLLRYVAKPQDIAKLPLIVAQAIGYKLATIVGPGLSLDLGKLSFAESKYKDALGKAGRFEKRDRSMYIPRRKWGDPT